MPSGSSFGPCKPTSPSLKISSAAADLAKTGLHSGLRPLRRALRGLPPVLAYLAASFVFLALLARAPFGRALAGIRVNEQRMRAAGFRTYGYKLAAFVIGGSLAGLAGFLMAVKDGAVNPELLSWHESGAVLLMIILGGIGSLRGAVLGAVAFTLLKELYQSEALLGRVAEHWQLTLGLTIIAFVALLPKGLIGLRQRLGLGKEAAHG